MTTPKINIVGCGRVGKTLARLFFINKAAVISGIVNSSYSSALDAIQFIGDGRVYQNAHDLPPADIYFITTRDDVIQKACEELISGDAFPKGVNIVHCSGSLTSDVLKEAKQKNCYIASIHPVKSFANPEDSVATFHGTYCAMEGDDALLHQLKSLFEQIGAYVFAINKQNKAIYHAAGVLANNYLITLHYYAVEAYKEAGIDDKTARQLVSMLMSGALENIKNIPHHKALTGPLQRGDQYTIENHMRVLNDHPEIKCIYAALGKSTLSLTGHSQEKKAEFVKLLDKRTNPTKKGK